MSKYPCIDSTGPMKRQEECCGCDKPSTHWVRVEFSYMNGEDEVYSVCQKHLQVAKSNLKQLFAHCGSKEKFLKNKGTS